MSILHVSMFSDQSERTTPFQPIHRNDRRELAPLLASGRLTHIHTTFFPAGSDISGRLLFIDLKKDKKKKKSGAFLKMHVLLLIFAATQSGDSWFFCTL